ITGSAELGKMSTALESMRKQLMANIKQLAGLNEMLQTQVSQQSDELHRQQFVLDSIDQTVRAPLDVREMLEQILTQTRQAGPVAQGAIYLFDAHGEHLQPVTFQGMTLSQVLQLQDVVQQAIAQQKPRYLSELSSELLPENFGSVLAIPLTCVDGSVVGGFLLADPHPNRFSVRQITLLSTIAGQTALIVQNSRLYSQLESQAIVEERSRLSREIHDGLVQTLGYLKMQVARMQGWLAEENTDRVRREMVNLEDVLEEVYAEARDAVVGLRVGVSPGDTLESLLTEYVQSFSARYELPVELTVNGQNPGVPDTTILHLIRITQEGLTNIRRHAKASRAWVQIDYQPTLLTLVIGDDGHGFDPAATAQNGASGVQFMRERAAELSGSLEITTRPGHGTEIRVTVPTEGIRPAEPALG
ncbi:MAG: GAF domain-containing protein, partial [Chloroflexi bacterium]